MSLPELPALLIFGRASMRNGVVDDLVWRKNVDARERIFVAEIERLRAEVEAMRADAERYRWLRLRYDGEAACKLGTIPDSYWGARAGKLLDADIDAARGQG